MGEGGPDGTVDTTNDRYGHDGSEDPEQQGPGGERQDHGQWVDPHVPADHEGLEGMGLDLVVEEQNGHHDDRGHQTLAQPGYSHRQHPGDEGADQRHEGAQADQDGQGEREWNPEDGQGDGDDDPVEAATTRVPRT